MIAYRYYCIHVDTTGYGIGVFNTWQYNVHSKTLYRLMQNSTFKQWIYAPLGGNDMCKVDSIISVYSLVSS